MVPPTYVTIPLWAFSFPQIVSSLKLLTENCEPSDCLYIMALCGGLSFCLYCAGENFSQVHSSHPDLYVLDGKGSLLNTVGIAFALIRHQIKLILLL